MGTCGSGLPAGLKPREAYRYRELSFDTCESSLICRLKYRKCGDQGAVFFRDFFVFHSKCSGRTSMLSLNDSSHALCIFRTLQLLSKLVNLQNFAKQLLAVIYQLFVVVPGREKPTFTYKGNTVFI